MKNANILIAGDSKTILYTLSSILSASGCQVSEAMDGQTALLAARRFSPDLILLDVHLSGISSYDLCRELKSREATCQIPVIFFSPSHEIVDRVPGFSAGGSDHITWPFQTDDLLARISAHLALHSTGSFAERVAADSSLSLVPLDNPSAEGDPIENMLEKDALVDQLREQVELTREILDTIPEGVVLLDGSGRVIQANLTAKTDLESILGVREGGSITQFGTKNISELLSPPPEGLFHEVTIDSRIFEIISRSIASCSTDQRWVMSLRDVTRARELESHSHQQERMAAVGQLAAGIAHDFNNILAVIILYSDMALGMPDLTPLLRERILAISQQSKRAKELIQQILDFSRRTMLERRPIDLLPFLKEQVKLLKRTLPENIRIELGAENTSYVVNADPTRVQQAIMNLAFNARDVMPDGGRLSIRLDRPDPYERIHCVACGWITEGDWIRIQISDTGAGISQEVLPHIFEPFFTTKSHGLGTGLGLSQVFGIVETHKGHMNVHTSQMTGTTFTLFLPALQARKYIEYATDPSSFIRGNRQMILVVEDEPATCQALSDSLSLMNYQVACTSNGTEAMAYLNAHPGEVALVLSDVVMPQMGGIALLQAIRQAGVKIPVILMTGHPLQNELDNLMENGLTAWFFKPPRLKHLAKLIGETLREQPESRLDN